MTVLAVLALISALFTAPDRDGEQLIQEVFDMHASVVLDTPNNHVVDRGRCHVDGDVPVWHFTLEMKCFDVVAVVGGVRVEYEFCGWAAGTLRNRLVPASEVFPLAAFQVAYGVRDHCLVTIPERADS